MEWDAAFWARIRIELTSPGNVCGRAEDVCLGVWYDAWSCGHWRSFNA